MLSFKEQEAQWAQEHEDLKALRAAKDSIQDAVDTYVSCQNKAHERALKKLMNFRIEGIPKSFYESVYYAKGDEDAPFFSEAFLYCLLGKEDARTVLAYVGEVLRSSGFEGTYDEDLEISDETT